MGRLDGTPGSRVWAVVLLHQPYLCLSCRGLELALFGGCSDTSAIKIVSASLRNRVVYSEYCKENTK